MTEPLDTLYFIGTKIIEWAIPFGLGLLFRKRVGRFFVKVKKYLFNDVFSINVLVARFYNPTEVNEVNHDLYDAVKTKLPSVKLLNLFHDGMRVSVPVFGNLRILIEKVDADVENSEESSMECVKTILSPESPIRLGMREIAKLNDLANYGEIILSEIEKLCLVKSKVTQSYILLDTSRIDHFKEEKAFKIEDEELGASVTATINQLTIVVSPICNVGRATQKYILT
jgi:hypothetical protein